MPTPQPFPKDLDPSQISQLAGSPVGKQLIARIQANGGTQLQQALNNAAGGNYEQAKKSLAPLLNSPEIQALIKQLGG